MKAIRILIVIAIVVVVTLTIGIGRFQWNGVAYRAFVPNIVATGQTLALDLPWLTNTLVTTFVIDAAILVLALLARRGIRQDGSPPGNTVAHAWEALIDRLYQHHLQPMLGKRAKAVIPIAVTAFTFILGAAMLILIPGVESVGIVKAAPNGSKGWCAAPLSEASGVALITGVPVDTSQGYAGSCDRADTVGTSGAQRGYAITPFLRRPTADMNTALALAVIAFLFVEIQGLRANGWHYFTRFFPVQPLRPSLLEGLLGNLQIFAGVLTLIVEFVRILSFAFRLFGSMFVGTVLVLVMGAILPVLLPTAFLGLEVAAGLVQAFVFLTLITVFTSAAVTSAEA